MAGIIAFFDILGYQSFLENNSAPELAKKTLQFINDLPKTLQKQVIELWMKSEVSKKSAFEAKEVKPLIFSDTIVLSIEYPENAEQNWKATAFTYLMYYSARLFEHMFFSGLPMRGAIVEGDFVFVESCLAGRAVVDAYRLCQSLDVAALVLDESIEKNWPNLSALPQLPASYVPYLTPFDHGSKEKRLIHVNWLWLGERHNDIRCDIETFVSRSFWGHKKDCPVSVDSKIRNTVKLIRRLFLAIDEDVKRNANPKK